MSLILSVNWFILLNAGRNLNCHWLNCFCVIGIYYLYKILLWGLRKFIITNWQPQSLKWNGHALSSPYGPPWQKTWLCCMQTTKGRPAWVFVQADQCLCFSLSGKYRSQTCSMQNFNVPASLYSWAGWLGLTLEETSKTGFLASRPI